MRRLALLLGFVLLSALGGADLAGAYYLDTPHNESNGIYCYTCHSMSYWRATPTGGVDVTIRNYICLQCHAEGSIDPHQGPAKRLHASSTTSTDKGTWSTECTQCHDVHSQGQLDWAGTDDTDLYLAGGDISNAGGSWSADGTLSPISGVTTFTISNIRGQSGWTDPAKWISKGGRIDSSRAVDGTRGLIFVPKVSNPSEAYEIVFADATTIKVKGKITTLNLGGGVFGVIYGQSLKSMVMPNGGTTVKDYRNVKFFKPSMEANTPGGFIDRTPGATKPLGLCQVCHVAEYVAYWTKTGAATTHNPDSDCSICHNVLTGLAPHATANHSEFIADRKNSGCAVCHPETVTNPDGGRHTTCVKCHAVDKPPAINTNGMTHDDGTTVLANIQNGGYTGIGTTGNRLRDANGKSIAEAGFIKIDCSECHESKPRKLLDSLHGGHGAAAFGWDGNCSDCHSGAEVANNVHGDVCTLCHVGSGDYSRQGGVDGTAVGASITSKCSNCHNVNPLGTVHHDTTPATSGDCTFCHSQFSHAGHGGDHSALVSSAAACIGCHTATAGTATTVPVDGIAHTKVHDACTSCHETTGVLRAAYGSAPGMSAGAAGSNNGGGSCTTCHTATFAGLHTSVDHSSRVANTANCSACHTAVGATLAPDDTTRTGRMVHDACSACHDDTSNLLRSAYGKASAMPVGGGDCNGCHGAYFVSHGNANHTAKVAMNGACVSCHNGSQGTDTGMPVNPANPMLHPACTTCHDATTGALVGLASGHTGGGDCKTCHVTNLHHTTSEALNNNCTTTCHPAVNHSSRVAGNGACTSCHTGTAGSATGIPLSLTDAAVHDSCRTCHTFDAQWRGVLVSFTNQKGVNGSGALPAGGGACTICHTVAATTSMATLGVLHHNSYRAVQGQCEYCHADPMPSWNIAVPGDNGTLSGLTPARPTQMACRECHVRFSGGGMTVSKFTRANYSSYSSAWTKTTAHTLPVTGTSINNYGICLGCHFVGSSKVPASAQVTIWHARPDKHGGSDWTFYDQPSSGVLGKRDTRYYCFGDVAHYAPGRSSSAIGGFNLFAPNYGMYSFQSPHQDANYANHTQGHTCGDPASRYTYQSPAASAPFIKITLPALTQLGTTSPQAVPVFASLAPKTGAPTLGSPTATAIGSTTATLGANITTSGASAIITARGTVWGTSASPTGIPVAEGGTATGLFSQARTSLPAGTKIYYRGYASSSEGTGYSPDGSFYTEPASQASLGSFTAVGQTGMTVNWTRGTGDGVIVLMKQGSAVTAAPMDGTYTSYTASTTFGSGTQIVPGTYVVYKGADTGVTVSGLAGNTSYSLAVYEYKGVVDTSGVDLGTNYKSSPATGSQITTPALTSPTATSIGSTTATLGGNVTAGGDATITARGTVWGTSANPTENALAEGGTSSGIFSHERTLLPAGSLIYYRGYATNSAGTGYSPSGSFYTEPATQASGVNFTAVGATTMTVNWTRGSGIGVLVLMKQGAAVSAEPVDGSDYTASSIFGGGTQIGTGNYVIYKGTGTSVALTGLLAGASYHVAVYEFTGYWYYTMAASTTYKATAAIASQTTTVTPPVLTTPTATAITDTMATLGANLTDPGGTPITASGTVWGTSANPTGNPSLDGGTAIGAFGQVRSGLPAGMKIFYRGYATNSSGTSYSPDGSFFTEPSTQAIGVGLSPVGATGMTVNWSRGNGDGVIVLMKQGTAVDAAPADGAYINYTGSPGFGYGSQIGAGNFVIYRGTGASVKVVGLSPNTTYSVAVYEYKGTVDTSGVDLGTNYQSSPATGNQTTGSVGVGLSSFTFNYTGSMQSLAIPAGAFNILFAVKGAGGGGGNSAGTNIPAENGQNGHMVVIAAAVSGVPVNIYVGNGGTEGSTTRNGSPGGWGYHPGGTGGDAPVVSFTWGGGGGGGSSAVVLGSNGSVLTEAGGGAGGKSGDTWWWLAPIQYGGLGGAAGGSNIPAPTNFTGGGAGGLLGNPPSHGASGQVIINYEL